jgi:hypothetical protein
MQMGNLISWLPIQNHVELCKSCSKSECKWWEINCSLQFRM